MQIVSDSALLVLDSVDCSGNCDYNYLYNKYSDILMEFKEIPLQHDTKHHIDLLEL